jgi:hypothetical protein
MKNKDLLTKIAFHNPYDYNILKAVEELNELSTALAQSFTKPNKLSEQEIIDEIGDVEIRLKILKILFSKRKVDERVQKKLKAYKNYLDDKKYKTI